MSSDEDDAGAERALSVAAPQITDAHLRLLAKNLPALCWIANPDGYIFWYDRRWHDYCGTTPAAMEGWGWRSVHAPAVLPSVMERWSASIDSGAPFEMTFPIKGADGVFRPFLTRIQPVKDAGAILWWVGTNTEITAQILAENELRDLNETLERQVAERTRELSSTWNVSADLLGILNLAGYFEACNPAWQTMLGWSVDEIRTTKFFGFIHPDDLPRTYAAWEDAQVGKPALSFENRYRRKDGGWYWLSWVAVPEGDKVYCSARDITAEKAAQADLS